MIYIHYFFNNINYRCFLHQIGRVCVYQVYDGATTSGLRLHPNNGFTFGTSPRITMTASSGEMLIRFVTDALHSSRGWKATFSAGRNEHPVIALSTNWCPCRTCAQFVTSYGRLSTCLVFIWAGADSHFAYSFCLFIYLSQTSYKSMRG